MKQERNIILRVILPLVAVSIMLPAGAIAAEKTTAPTTEATKESVKENKKLSDAPPPPGPYRSFYDMKKQDPAKRSAMQDARQWTPPTPPQWVQDQRKQFAQQPDWSKRQQPPKWVQQQRKQRGQQQPVPPVANSRQLPPPPWMQNRMMPPMNGMNRPVPPPVWANRPYQPYRRW